MLLLSRENGNKTEEENSTLINDVSVEIRILCGAWELLALESSLPSSPHVYLSIYRYKTNSTCNDQRMRAGYAFVAFYNIATCGIFELTLLIKFRPEPCKSKAVWTFHCDFIIVIYFHRYLFTVACSNYDAEEEKRRYLMILRSWHNYKLHYIFFVLSYGAQKCSE